MTALTAEEMPRLQAHALVLSCSTGDELDGLRVEPELRREQSKELLVGAAALGRRAHSDLHPFAMPPQEPCGPCPRLHAHQQNALRDSAHENPIAG